MQVTGVSCGGGHDFTSTQQLEQEWKAQVESTLHSIDNNLPEPSPNYDDNNVHEGYYMDELQHQSLEAQQEKYEAARYADDV